MSQIEPGANDKLGRVRVCGHFHRSALHLAAASSLSNLPSAHVIGMWWALNCTANDPLPTVSCEPQSASERHICGLRPYAVP